MIKPEKDIESFNLLDTRTHFAVFVSGGPLVSVAVDGVLVDALRGVLRPDVRPLLAEIAQVSGHQFEVVARKAGKAVGYGMNLKKHWFQ